MPNWRRPDMGASIQRGGEVGEGSPLFKPKSGEKGRFADNWIRILPIRGDSPYEEFYFYAAVHFPPGQGGLPFLCGRKMFDAYPEGGYNAACPACDAAVYGPDGEGGARWYAVMNVVAVNDEGEPEDGQVLIWACPRTVLSDLLGRIDDLPEDKQDITDPETGFAVCVRRKGEGKKNTRYEISLSEEPVPLADPDELCEGLHDITNTYRVLEPSRVAALLGEGEDPFDGEEGAAPSRPRLRAATGGDGEEEAEEGEFRPVDPEEEEAPEEKPTPKPKPRRTSAAKPSTDKPEAKARSELKRKLTAASN